MLLNCCSLSEYFFIHLFYRFEEVNKKSVVPSELDVTSPVDSKDTNAIRELVGASIMFDEPTRSHSTSLCISCSQTGHRKATLSPCTHKLCTDCIDKEFDERPHEDGFFLCPMCKVIVDDVKYEE